MADEEQDKNGIRQRVGRYAGKRVLGQHIGLGSGFIRNTAKQISVMPDMGRIRSYWYGPKTDQEGDELFQNLIRPSFEDDDSMDSAAVQMKMFGILLAILSFLLALGAILIDDSLFKLGAFIGFLMLGLHATIQFHRSEQIRNRRIFGLKYLF